MDSIVSTLTDSLINLNSRRIQVNYECGLNALPGEIMCFWHLPKGDMKTADIYRQYLGNEEKLMDMLRCFPEKKLIGFQLPGVTLKETDFFCFDFSLINLSHSDLSQAFLRETRFMKVTGRAGCFDKANFSRSVLNDSNWEGGSFREAYLNECEIRHCELSDADFMFAQIRHSFLDGSRGKRLKMDEANFTETSFKSVDFEDVSCRMSQLLNVAFIETRLKNATFVESTLIGAQFSKAFFENVRFHEVNMRHCRIRNSVFRLCQFHGVDFSESQYEDNIFESCRFVECEKPALAVAG